MYELVTDYGSQGPKGESIPPCVEIRETNTNAFNGTRMSPYVVALCASFTKWPLR